MPNLYLVFGLLTLVLPQALSAEVPWWNARWNYRLPIIVDAGMYDRKDYMVAKRFDFGVLIKEAGASGDLDWDSIRMVEVNKAGETKEIPVSIRKISRDSSGKTEKADVIWRMDGTTEALEERFYYLYFDTLDNGRKEKAESPPVIEEGLSLPGENMVVNGDFSEGLNGWTVSGPEVKVVTDVRHNNNNAVRIIGKGHISQRIPLKEGKKYTLSCYIKIEKPVSTTGLVVTMWLTTAGGQPGQIHSNYKYQFGTNVVGDWLLFETSKFCYYTSDKTLVSATELLPGTAEGLLEIGTYGDGGICYVSEVKCVEITEPPCEITLQPVEKRSSK
jgi:hypothetical protein